MVKVIHYLLSNRINALSILLALGAAWTSAISKQEFGRFLCLGQLRWSSLISKTCPSRETVLADSGHLCKQHKEKLWTDRHGGIFTFSVIPETSFLTYLVTPAKFLRCPSQLRISNHAMRRPGAFTKATNMINHACNRHENPRLRRKMRNHADNRNGHFSSGMISKRYIYGVTINAGFLIKQPRNAVFGHRRFRFW